MNADVSSEDADYADDSEDAGFAEEAAYAAGLERENQEKAGQDAEKGPADGESAGGDTAAQGE